MKQYSFYSIILLVLFSCNNTNKKSSQSESNPLIYPQEVHFENMKQLTFGGENAEAYWSFDDSKLIFQATNEKWGQSCDQIYIIDTNNYNLNNEMPKMVSLGLGRTTCSYFMPGDSTIIYASTHLEDAKCPHVPERRVNGKYVWPIYDSYDIFIADLDGNIISQLTDTPGYDAEATVSPTGDKIVFTSIRSGDLELYTCNIDGSEIRQVTNQLGYDGGAFFSHDGKKLVFRASRPKNKEEIEEYKALLSNGLVQPTKMEIYICNVDGSDLRQVTNLGDANWSPFFHPSNEKIIFCSNHESIMGFPFNLYMIDIDGNNLEQITYDEKFASFPVFSNDGKKITFSSNRNNGGTRNTNVFIANWKE
jgi:Tol biopolymer transport system component